MFDTLDPTVRKVEGMHCGDVLLADTVGFVSDLPHELIAAFRATLQEARDADILLHVIDASDPYRMERQAEVEEVLASIDTDDIPVIRVFNKVCVKPCKSSASMSRQQNRSVRRLSSASNRLPIIPTRWHSLIVRPQ